VPDPVIFGCTGDVGEDDDGYAVASLWTRGPTGRLLGGDGSRPTDAQGGYSRQDAARVDGHWPNSLRHWLSSTASRPARVSWSGLREQNPVPDLAPLGRGRILSEVVA